MTGTKDNRKVESISAVIDGLGPIHQVHSSSAHTFSFARHPMFDCSSRFVSLRILVFSTWLRPGQVHVACSCSIRAVSAVRAHWLGLPYSYKPGLSRLLLTVLAGPSLHLAIGLSCVYMHSVITWARPVPWMDACVLGRKIAVSLGSGGWSGGLLTWLRRNIDYTTCESLQPWLYDVDEQGRRRSVLITAVPFLSLNCLRHYPSFLLYKPPRFPPSSHHSHMSEPTFFHAHLQPYGRTLSCNYVIASILHVVWCGRCSHTRSAADTR